MAPKSAAPERTRTSKPRVKEVRVHTSAAMRIGAGSASQSADAFRRDSGFEQGVMAGLSVDHEPTGPERLRMVRLSRLNYKRAGIYGQIADTLANFVVGDGVALTFKDPTVGKFVNSVLDDPRNEWHRTYRQRIITLLVDGEYVLTVTVPIRGRDATGAPIPTAAVLFGRLNTEDIEQIRTAKVNVDRIIDVGIRTDDGTGKIETYPIARPDVPLHEDEDGLCGVLLWRVNSLGKRGIPYLSRSLDKATMLDAVVEELARKTEYSSRFWLHATYTPTGTSADAKTEETLTAWLSSWKPGEVAVTTDGVKVVAIAPTLNLPDAVTFVEMLLGYILGAHGSPRAWYGSGGETNRATTVEQGTPIHRAIDALQGIAKMDYEEVVRFVISIGKRSGVILPTTNCEFSVTMADVATRDSMRDVDEISGSVAALDAAVASQIISEEERQKIGRRIIRAKNFGDLLTDATAPKIVKPVTLAPPPPGSMPGFPNTAGKPTGAPPPLVPAPAPAPGA